PRRSSDLLDEWGADAIGLNCSVGPHGILSALEAMASTTQKKLSAQPNAGLPREVHGRQIYMASPEYFGKYAQRLIRAGAKLIGGCCGTTPEHIRRMADAVHALAPRRVIVPATAPGPELAPQARTTPLPARADWGRRLAAAALVTSVETVPPRGTDPAKMLAGVRRLKRAGIDAVNVPAGPRAQMRMGALATSVLVEQKVGIEAGV